MYYAAYRRSQQGWNVMPTARNARGVDLLAYDVGAHTFETNDEPSQLVELVSQLSQAPEFPGERISPTKRAMSDLDRPEQAISIADRQFDTGAGLGNIRRLQAYIHRVTRLYLFRLS